MDCMVISDTGRITPADPDNTRGVGLPDDLTWLDDLTAEQAHAILPGIVRHLDRRLRVLEDRA